MAHFLSFVRALSGVNVVQGKTGALQKSLEYHFHSAFLAEAHPDCFQEPYKATFSTSSLAEFSSRFSLALAFPPLMGGIQCN